MLKIQIRLERNERVDLIVIIDADKFTEKHET